MYNVHNIYLFVHYQSTNISIYYIIYIRIYLLKNLLGLKIKIVMIKICPQFQAKMKNDFKILSF